MPGLSSHFLYSEATVLKWTNEHAFAVKKEMALKKKEERHFRRLDTNSRIPFPLCGHREEGW